MLLPLPVLAATTSALEACTKVTDDSARLACFDREAAALISRGHAPAAAAASVAAAPAASPAPLTEEQKMGLSSARIEQLQRPPSAPPPIQTLTVAITGVSADGNGHQLFTLENGQVWRQVELDTHFSAKPGDSITISRGISGSYFLSLGKHSNTRVSRVR